MTQLTAKSNFVILKPYNYLSTWFKSIISSHCARNLCMPANFEPSSLLAERQKEGEWVRDYMSALNYFVSEVSVMEHMNKIFFRKFVSYGLVFTFSIVLL